MSINYSRVQSMAQSMSDRAVTTGVIREAEGNFSINFNRATSCYDVTYPDGSHYASYRTYKITEAKRWFREARA